MDLNFRIKIPYRRVKKNDVWNMGAETIENVLERPGRD
jgi:hypothetical protein